MAAVVCTFSCRPLCNVLTSVHVRRAVERDAQPQQTCQLLSIFFLSAQIYEHFRFSLFSSFVCCSCVFKYTSFGVWSGLHSHFTASDLCFCTANGLRQIVFAQTFAMLSAHTAAQKIVWSLNKKLSIGPRNSAIRIPAGLLSNRWTIAMNQTVWTHEFMHIFYSTGQIMTATEHTAIVSRQKRLPAQ